MVCSTTPPKTGILNLLFVYKAHIVLLTKLELLDQNQELDNASQSQQKRKLGGYLLPATEYPIYDIPFQKLIQSYTDEALMVLEKHTKLQERGTMNLDILEEL